MVGDVHIYSQVPQQLQLMEDKLEAPSRYHRRRYRDDRRVRNLWLEKRVSVAA